MRLGMAMRLGVSLAVRAARTAGLGAGAQRLVDNGLDGARAAAAFGTAAEATVDLLGIPGKVFRAIDRTADIVVGQDVAGTNNHETSELFRGRGVIEILKSTVGCKRKNPDFKQFQTGLVKSRMSLKLLRQRHNCDFPYSPLHR
jgi:hypothetical protein